MDILAHGLWTALAVTAVKHYKPLSAPRWPLAATLSLAVLPDLLHLLPVLLWSVLGGTGWATVWAYAVATPGTEPALPFWVEQAAHHLHCLMHSLVVAVPLGAFIAWVRHGFWWPLIGWYGHIIIDVFTHSAQFYPSPLWYPVSMRGFDGLAWNEPRWLLLNYLMLALCGALLAWRRLATRRADENARR